MAAVNPWMLLDAGLMTSPTAAVTDSPHPCRLPRSLLPLLLISSFNNKLSETSLINNLGVRALRPILVTKKNIISTFLSFGPISQERPSLPHYRSSLPGILHKVELYLADYIEDAKWI
jgi:hypothetical protein